MQPVLMWGVNDGGHMYLVDTMARAYVTQKKYPGSEAYVLRIPESGFWEIERGPVTLVRKGRLFGDPVNSPFLTGLMMYIGYVACGYLFLLALIEDNPVFLIVSGIVVATSSFVRRCAAKNMLCSIERMERFMGQVRKITGQEGIEDFAAEYFGCEKGVGHGR